MDVLPWIDAGLAIVIFTIIVKLILFPLSKKAVTTQLKMKKVEPELNALKEKYKDDKQLHAKNHGALSNQWNQPFAGIILILIQLPIIIALYRVFLSGFSNIDASILYSFVHVPTAINTEFLGLVDITSKSLILALLAGVSSFIQVKLSVPPVSKSEKLRENMTKEERFKHDLTRSMGLQMRYMLPALRFCFLDNFWRNCGVLDHEQSFLHRTGVGNSSLY